MSIKGTFDSYYASYLLKLFHSEKKSGELSVKKEKDETTVYFSEGNVVYATSTLKELRLGAFLIQQEIITPEQHEMCIEISKARKSPLGKILLEKGYLTSVELKQIIGEQIEQILFNLLLWEKGNFEFSESDTPHKGVDITPIDILALIEDASQRIEEMTVLLKQIPNDQMIFKMADDVSEAGEIKLNASEWRVLALVNGQRPVKQLVEDSGFEEFEVYKVLSSLLATGHIQEHNKTSSIPSKKSESEEIDMHMDLSDLEDVEKTDEPGEPPPLENKLTAEKKTKIKEPIKKKITTEPPKKEVKSEPPENKESSPPPELPEAPKDEDKRKDAEVEAEPAQSRESETKSEPEKPPARTDISESDLSEMIMVYIDILKPIQKILENELGMEAFSIIEDSKRQLNSHQKRILKNFRADNPGAANIHEVIDAINETPESEDAHQLVILSFSNLIQKILLKVPDILGVQPTRKMLQEIERVIYHIDNEQSEMVKKTTIIDGIKDVLLETERVLNKQ